MRIASGSTAAPETFSNPVLLGTLVVPLGFPLDGQSAREAAAPRLGTLPVARRDIERLYQVLALQRRLRDPNVSPRSARALVARGAFADALTWLEIHGDAPEAVARWRAQVDDLKAAGALPGTIAARAGRGAAGAADRGGQCKRSRQ